MMDLNDDIIGHIMACFDMGQVNNCYYLASTCRRFYNCFQKNKRKINDHFTHVIIDGNKETHYYGDKIHRSPKTSSTGTDNDLPAIIRADGTQAWYHHGELHRNNDKPAVIWFNGDHWWYQYGERHRDNDLPAIINVNGACFWYQYGELHRNNDLPAVVCADGKCEWYKDGVIYHP